MKRLILVLAYLSLSSLAIAQGSEKDGFTADFSVVSRLEGNPWIDFSGSPTQTGIDMGSSSLYFLGDGQITENLSFSFLINPLNTDPAALYNNTFRSDDFNWLNWASLTYSFGDFSVTAGKSYWYCASFEEDEYDYDSYAFLNTSVWNNFPIYQWGAGLSWAPTESFSLSANTFTSPYGDYIFKSGLFGFSGIAACEMKGLSAMLGFGIMPDGTGEWVSLMTCGLKAEVGAFTLVNDFYSKVWNPLVGFADGISDALGISWAYNDKWNFGTRFVIDSYQVLSDYDQDFRAGLICEYRPIEDLRLHATAGYEFGDIASYAAFSIGATYTLSFSL